MKRNTDSEGAAKTPGQAIRKSREGYDINDFLDEISYADIALDALGAEEVNRDGKPMTLWGRVMSLKPKIEALEGIANPAAVKQLVEAAGSIVLAIYEDRELGALNAKLDDALEALNASVPKE